MVCKQSRLDKKESLGSILIVEDSNLINKALCKGLKGLGHEVSTAKTLKDALVALASHSFDLVVLDLNLPDGEGEEILQNLSAKQKLKIVVYTSDADKERRNEWFRYGVLGYLSKTDPFAFVIKEIDKTIKSLLENTFYTILIIDDSAFICRQISSLLQPRNYKIITATNGSDAKALLNETAFDLVILDLELPDMRGEEILKMIRKKTMLSEIPVFIMTGTYGASDVGNLIKQGANEFFLKPFIAEELLLKIDFWIEIRRKTQESLCQQKILQEYKDAVDRSSIVSKTDKKGIITFANEMFCQVSGYTREELIGKPHNIVRHPDMPKEVFKELWKTILAANPWHGIVKNRKKDGSAYWMDTTINPIVDKNGTIVEFICIRTDVTDIQMVRNALKNQLKISENNFEDAYHLSQQYEHAINESTIVTRTDLQGNITFANQHFYDTTGYTEAEVIGKNHRIIHHNDTPSEVIANLWKTIELGKIWRGVLKNQKKDGAPYWVDSTLLPIKDKMGNNVEYMAIRKEITEIMSLHQEIETTQQEVIYRMGEIAESRSQETGNHVRRVAEYSRLLALKYGLSKKEADLIATASPMHDIGKVGIPDAILLKPAALTQEEWKIMRTHALLGHSVLANSERPLLKAAAIIAKEHHEKYDGTGYPIGLVGDNIHLYARIVAIADVFDALSHDRCYKKAWEMQRILQLFQDEKGKHFDPQLIDIFFQHTDEFLTILNQLRD